MKLKLLLTHTNNIYFTYGRREIGDIFKRIQQSTPQLRFDLYRNIFYTTFYDEQTNEVRTRAHLKKL